MIRICIHLVLGVRVKFVATFHTIITATHTSVPIERVLHIRKMEGPGYSWLKFRGRRLLRLTVTLAFPQEQDTENDKANQGSAANCPADYSSDVVRGGWRGGSIRRCCR